MPESSNPPKSPEVRRLRSAIAGTTRHNPNAPSLPYLRRDLDVELLAASIAEVVDGLPAPTAEQRTRLISIIAGGAR